jgi:hypothetical protein
MGRFEVQGIVSVRTGEPLVQFRQLDDEDNEVHGFQVGPDKARELAHTILEAASNSVYDAALIAWAQEAFPEDKTMGPSMVNLIREFRVDRWGLSGQPEDWRKPDQAEEDNEEYGSLESNRRVSSDHSGSPE